MEGIKYVNLIEIGQVVIEIRGAENGELAVLVNSTLVSHTAFLAADTQSCVLIAIPSMNPPLYQRNFEHNGQLKALSIMPT